MHHYSNKFSKLASSAT